MHEVIIDETVQSIVFFVKANSQSTYWKSSPEHGESLPLMLQGR